MKLQDITIKILKVGRRIYINIFSKDKIFIPVNISNKHWSLIVVNIQLKKIYYYDSLGWDGRISLDSTLKWIHDESNNKFYQYKLDHFNFKEWKLIVVKDTPQQPNGYDCGIYVIIFADLISKNNSLNSFSINLINRTNVCANILRGYLID